MKRILLIDNYDSFTYNLVQAFGELGCDILVRRNDTLGLEEAQRLEPTHVVISPGPGNPTQAGVSNLMIRYFGERRVPVLGVCLGHQCIGHVFGGEVVCAPRMMHGKVSKIYHDSKNLFKALPNPFEATRYHSLIVKEETLPAALEITAHTSEGEVMGLRHKEFPIEGVQFHPESILTSVGKQIVQNFLEFL